MKTRKRTIQALPILGLAILLFACEVKEPSSVRSYEEQFDDIKEIEVNGRFLEVSYEGNNSTKEVFLNGYLEVPERSSLDIKYRKSGSKLIVEVTGETTAVNFFNFGGSNSGFISLTGPEDIKLNLSNSSGSVDVKYVKHDIIDLKVNSGSIKALAIDVNQINLRASSGSIRGEGLVGNVDAQVNSGSIRLQEVKGDVTGKASSGSFRAEDVDGTVHAKVNSGSIKLEQVKYLGELSVSSGGITANQSGLSEFTKLQSNSGSIKIQTNTDLTVFNYELSANSGSVTVGEEKSTKKLEIDNGSAHTIRGKSSSGSIKITN
ncbi:DUF4097 and DUF4098 domain-containing protein YvlB [Belliella buryatensis]|uniref:DUF4097 and DUF4098 domain-containing protein YvlB n=1 Tax=Belliella buryatensis TaxID=1500549 RepID=A0A239C5A7_9BACT|nr:DUF4097 family beta strand repeat-containing protein [Belliella buryatensis]SNS14553.1 DUF4097 and DUF4098 domain-containing protein YvlB [Belliella buryatensis]